MDPFLQDMPGDRSVNGTGIDIDKTEPPGEFSRDAALARGSRTINRDHLLKNLLRGGHETEVPSLVAPPAELKRVAWLKSSRPHAVRSAPPSRLALSPVRGG